MVNDDREYTAWTRWVEDHVDRTPWPVGAGVLLAVFVLALLRF